MYVKVYQFYLQKNKVEEYFLIQEKASAIYSKYIQSETMYLNSNEDETKWIEITRYKDEEEYNKSIALINKEKEIQQLFNQFQSLLVSDKNEIFEEDFVQIKKKFTF
ncbi:hypothetical protein [Ureibacillus acetophenoni]|uniref:ABM domain-containing protein n=1 Tax=Ureibacillus acetophenoni TaxID=614649 RepID=A0A285UQK0_9BACL|nr:hypothetical protein [Ureibacillus acetophenoni]SOC42531.1 hypothetical protein SAMN05877842_11324 [Ureibacillus acetophenoni]